MTLLDHGDFRKSGRAILIACTVYVLLFECSSNFSEVSLFEFQVRISQARLLEFLNIGIWVLVAIYLIRFLQNIHVLLDLLFGETATSDRERIVIDQAKIRSLDSYSRESATNYVEINPTKPGQTIDGQSRLPSDEERLKIIGTAYSRYRMRRCGDLFDVVVIQICVPLGVLVYTLFGSPALKLICS